MHAHQVNVDALEQAKEKALRLKKKRMERLSDPWMKISTAPKDKEVFLFYPGTGAVRGHWFEDSLSPNPRPHWRNDRLFLWGIRRSRNEQPTHWMHLPQPPKNGD